MSLERALAAWAAIVGEEHVVQDGDGLRHANQATFDTATGEADASRAIAIIEPETREQVAACVHVARQFRIPIYPLSTGRNYGYGSMLPARGACAVLRLRRLNRIVDTDPVLATVTLEPGVTFAGLAEHLREHAPHLLPPQTGGPPDGSIVGVFMERGICKGRYRDLSAHTLACEIVLANGVTLHSGFGALENARMTGIAAQGPGPSLERLFQQSGLGIVTSLTLRLDPAPALTQRAILRLEGHDNLAALIDRLRPVLQRGGEAVMVELINDYREIAQLHQFPFAQLGPDTVLPRFWGGPRWTCAASITGESEGELSWKRESVAHPGFVWEPPVRANDPPGNAGLDTAYWRKRELPPADPQPDRDRCGVIWFSPLVPMLGCEVTDAVRLIEETMLNHGFEPAISLRCDEGRSIRIIAGILFDRDQPGADKRALACHDALWNNLAATGIYPCRFTIRDMNRAPWSAGSRAVLFALKAALDPDGILAPGRYE